MFDPHQHLELNADAAVVRHELGHAALWLVHGGAIGRLQMRRVRGQLYAGIRLERRTREIGDADQLYERTAERLLAGEVAARRHTCLPVDELSIGDRPPRSPLTRWSPFDVHNSFADRREDLARAALISARKEDWLGWLAERLRSAVTTIAEHWRGIDEAAEDLTRDL